MRAIIYHQHDDIRLEEVPIPTIGPGELLARSGLVADRVSWVAGGPPSEGRF